MTGLKTVLNTNSEDISAMVIAAAIKGGVEPWELLACIRAESKLNPRAERYGYPATDTWAKVSLASKDYVGYQRAIDEAWPDISFGYGQQTVGTIKYGDKSADHQNVVAVKEYVFNNPDKDLEMVAGRLRNCIDRGQGDLLRGLVVYNSGGDNLDEEWYRRKYATHITEYRSAITWAQDYIEEEKDAALRSLDALWGTAQAVRQLSEQRADEMQVWIVSAKDYIQAH